MTERKPPGVSFETFVDKQIREAAERGAFDDLPGAGEPLAAVDAPYDELWWVKGKMRREGLSYLPPALTLRKKAEDTLAVARAAPSERRVRELVAGINEEIRAFLARPAAGPLLNMKPFDVEEVVRDWRGQRPGHGPSGNAEQ